VVYSHVISTISGSKLNALVQPDCDLSVLALTPAVTVMVVNLYYTNPNLLSVHGFGYLIPRSIPFDQNPERALGVVFDSDATIGQDAIPGTKLTVMLGGHWWDGWDSYPDEEEGAYMAKSILARHLGISEEPQAVRVALQKDCIPQYTVGHAERMMRAHEQLLASFRGRLKVAGSYYTGVGLNDCVRAGYSVSHSFQQPYECTGLEDLVPGLQKWERYAHDKFE
jgi:oxygen-dependent protoporphyrinogen oxidase